MIEEELPSLSRTDAPDAGLSTAHSSHSEMILLCFHQINICAFCASSEGPRGFLFTRILILLTNLNGLKATTCS